MIVTDGENATHMIDSQGRAVPVERVRAWEKLMDQTVRVIVGHGRELSAQVARFKGHTFDDIVACQELLAENYNVKRGGARGNVTLTSFDGLMRVHVKHADNIVFGPELQVAKHLVDEYIAEFSDGLPSEIEVLLTHAFQTDKEGVVNRAALYSLRRLDMGDHPKWRAAMEAIADSMRVIGARTYIVIETRETLDAPWRAIPINLAKA